MFAAVFLICSIGAENAPVPVDVAEINTVYDQNGCYRFTQVILWRWMAEGGRCEHVVAQWELIEKWGCEPRRNGRNVVWWINTKGKVFRVSARSFRPPYRCFRDHEHDNRAVFPENSRVPYPLGPNSNPKNPFYDHSGVEFP